MEENAKLDVTREFAITTLSDSKEVRLRILQIASVIHSVKPELLKGEVGPIIEEISSIMLKKRIAVMVLEQLLKEVDDLKKLPSILQRFERRLPRPDESFEETFKEIKEIISRKPRLFQHHSKAEIIRNIQAITNFVRIKKINNADFAYYVERCRTLEELRKMCAKAKPRIKQR